MDFKVPTEIILDDKNDVIQFGSECVKFLKDKGLTVGHYFKGIKMKLYENKNTITSSNSGRELPLKLVIQKVLEEIKRLAIKEISKNRPYLKEQTNKIKWVVTVPAIWNEHQKSIMMESCIGAGLVNNDTDKSLFFALEPEAASLYCSINKEIDRNYFKKGEYYIVCDLGGGTGDIVAHLIGSNNTLNEIFPSCGGNFGSNEIDKSIFKDVILKLFGCQDFNTFYLKYSKKNNNIKDKDSEKATLFNDWCELEREIKDFKEGTTLTKIENNTKCSINCSLFQDIFDDDIDINDLVKEYNDNVNDSSLLLSVRAVGRRWIVEFPYEIVFSYMKTQANSICDIINGINLKEDIKTIIFVGGYCYNEIVVNLIKNNLKKIKVCLQPSNPSLAIMEGAVLFGIEPSSISIRKAKYTIGKKSAIPWNDKKHSGKGEKFYVESMKAWFCKDCFEKFIEKDQNIKYEESISHENLVAGVKGAKVLRLEFYKTLKTNPIFILEEGVIKIGECKLEIGTDFKNLEDRKIKTTLKFGGTFIDVTAVHLKTGKSVKTTLTFD